MSFPTGRSFFVYFLCQEAVPSVACKALWFWGGRCRLLPARSLWSKFLDHNPPQRCSDHQFPVCSSMCVVVFAAWDVGAAVATLVLEDAGRYIVLVWLSRCSKTNRLFIKTINHIICELYVTGVVLIALSSSRMVGAIVGFGPEQDRTTVPLTRLLFPTEGLGLEVLLYYWLHSLLWSDMASFEWSRCIQSPECEDDIGKEDKIRWCNA